MTTMAGNAPALAGSGTISRTPSITSSTPLKMVYPPGRRHKVPHQVAVTQVAKRPNQVVARNGQGAELRSILQLIHHEAHTPGFVPSRGLDLILANSRSLPLPDRFHPLQRQLRNKLLQTQVSSFN